MAAARALHWVFRVTDRQKVMSFYKDVLGMKVLRHEEFEQPCEAACNGPFSGRWSKTMVGYGPEDNHFVVELTYNYDNHEYVLGNDYQYIRIHSKEAAARAEANGGVREGNVVRTSVPIDGYRYEIVDEDVEGDPVRALRLHVSNIDRSQRFWEGVLGMSVVKREEAHAGDVVLSLSFGHEQCTLELEQRNEDKGAALNHGTAFGRIAFAYPSDGLGAVQDSVKSTSGDNGGSVIKELVSLDTPGKATVHVVILGDPDSYEICFVGDEAFRELSKVDPKGDALLEEAMSNDKSMEWWAKKKARGY